MRLFTYFFPVIFFIPVCISGQTTLPNMGLEEWTYEQVNDTLYYEEPSGGIWTTANRACRLNPAVFKVTTFKTDDAYQGAYAARIITDIADLPGPNDLLMTGTLATGTFNELAPPPTNLKDGVPFTDRPSSFKSYYKYFPVEHDSCDIYSLLYKWNSALQQRDTIAYAWLTDTVTVSQYTLLDLPYVYLSEEQPDTITIIFATSAAGDLFEGQVGSTLYVDAIALGYPSGFEQALMPETEVKVYPNPADNEVNFEISEHIRHGKIVLYNNEARIYESPVFNGNTTRVRLNGYASGNYYFQVFDGGYLLNSGTFVIINH